MENLRLLLALGAVLAMASCGETRYVGYDQSEDANPFARTVEFEVTGAFYRDPPTCAVVLPFTTPEGKPHPQARMVEEALARQFSGRLGRIIGPREREHLRRRLAVDLTNARDRQAFARGARCEAAISATPWGGESTFVVVWTQERAGLEAVMKRLRDDAVLWRARHVATRSEGGVPFSPFSALYNAVEATAFQADGDVGRSVIDDAARRIARTLPDTRGLSSGLPPATMADTGLPQGR